MKIVEKGAFLDALSDRDTRCVVERFALSQVTPSWCLHDRQVAQHYLTLMQHGHNTVSVGNIRKTLGAGERLWVLPQVPHSMQPVHAPHTFYHLRFSVFQGKDALTVKGDGWYAPASSGATRRMQQLLDEYQTSQHWRDRQFRAVLLQYCVDMWRDEQSAHSSRSFTRQLQASQRLRLDKIMRMWMNKPLTPGDFAQTLGLNPDYFSRLFKATYGMPARTWIVQQRMLHAAWLLRETPMTITDVARECSYQDIFLFSRLFKQVHGQSPRHYRSD